MVSILTRLSTFLGLILLGTSPIVAQTCTGNFPAGTVCGNIGTNQSQPSPVQTTLDIAGVASLRTRAVTNSQVLHLRYFNVAGDLGAGYFVGSTGQPAGTYVDNGVSTIVPTGGNGSAAWLRIGEAKNWTRVSTPYTRWVSASITSDLQVFTLSPMTKITGFYLDVTQGFSGVTGCCTIQAGTSTGANDLIVNSNISTPKTLGLAAADVAGGKLASANLVQGGYMAWTGTGVFLRLGATANIGNGTVTSLTTGNIDVYIQTERMSGP